MDACCVYYTCLAVMYAKRQYNPHDADIIMEEQYLDKNIRPNDEIEMQSMRNIENRPPSV